MNVERWRQVGWRWPLGVVAGAGVVATAVAALAFIGEPDGAEVSAWEAPNIDLKVPNTGLKDWVSYADHVVVATVLSEAESGPWQSHGDGTRSVGRVVTLQIEHVLWSAPGVPGPGEELVLSDWGWSIVDGERKAWGEHMRVGERYLLPLARFGEDVGFIGAAGYPVEGERVSEVLSGGRSWLSELGGMELTELATRLVETQPDPRAAELRHLPADERVLAVLGGGVFPAQ